MHKVRNKELERTTLQELHYRMNTRTEMKNCIKVLQSFCNIDANLNER